MKRIALLAVVAVALALPAGASAGVVTVGSKLTGNFLATSCGPPCTLIQTGLPAPAVAVSPVSGTVIRWRLLGGSPEHPYRFRVFSAAGAIFTSTGAGAPVSPSGPEVQTFPVSIPIQAGQMIGLDMQADAPLGYRLPPGASYAYITPPAPDGVPTIGVSASEFPYEFGFNADVLPPPAITSISPAKGILASGSTVKVKIAGTDFSEVTGVAFGGVPTTYTVDSETQITAIPAAQRKPGPQAVTVTTLAGTATAPKPYRYTACVVPNLAGKKLKQAKRLIRKGECKLGFVKKRGGATAKSGRVVAQKPRAGRIVRTGSKLRVTLAE